MRRCRCINRLHILTRAAKESVRVGKEKQVEEDGGGWKEHEGDGRVKR